MTYSDQAAMRRYQADWKRRRREQWLAANGPCAHCGSLDQLVVDHKDRTTKVDHKVWSWSEQRRHAELAKCQVLCRSCHKTKTVTENTVPLVHGEARSYKTKGCRCQSCRDAAAAYQREWKKRN